MKWLIYLLLAAGLGFGWFKFMSDGKAHALEKRIEQIQNSGGEDEELAKAKADLTGHKNERTFTGILLAFVSAGLVGVVFVIDVLPAIAQRMTHAVYDSAEEVEQDALHDARSKLAQGDYAGAIEAFQRAAEEDPMNRVPWVEIAKIYREHLEDPASAITTLRTALEGQEWEINDASYLMFRVAELYDEDCQDRASATVILQQVIDQFPETRHAANARHRLHEWGVI
jgi:tetratricopeptide (TPR) repeat protein